jgi:hypothetical protein
VKLVKSLLVFGLLSLIGAYVYFTRAQEVNVKLMPLEFRLCGKIYTSNHSEYVEIRDWLNENKSGWSIDWNTPIAGLVYSYPSYSIVVFPTGVHVGYKTDNGYTRLIKSIKHNLKTSCESVS